MGRTEYEFNITGVACHGAQSRMNKEAVNAVHESTKLQNKIIKYYEDNEKTFSSSGVSITNSAYISHQDGGRAILSVPDKASFVVDRSFVMNESMDQEIEILKELIAESYDEGILDSRVKITVKERERPTSACKPYFFSQDNVGVKYVTEIVDTVTGSHEYGIGYSVADENRLAELGMTTIVLGPKGSNSHAAQEWVDIESVENLTKIYRKIAENFKNYLTKNLDS
jgi:acetylornithine deacetylase/succinyl-diaminopimelate desuccinylase-like protein